MSTSETHLVHNLLLFSRFFKETLHHLTLTAGILELDFTALKVICSLQNGKRTKNRQQSSKLHTSLNADDNFTSAVCMASWLPTALLSELSASFTRRSKAPVAWLYVLNILGESTELCCRRGVLGASPGGRWLRGVLSPVLWPMRDLISSNRSWAAFV